jgi:hypothetical protein
MPAVTFNPFKSLDKYFLICKIATLLFCLPWPLTPLATVMSLAGYIPPDTPMVKVVLIRLAWLLVLIYPVVFFAVVFFGREGVGTQVIRIRGCCSVAASRFQFVGYGCNISDLGYQDPLNCLR